MCSRGICPGVGQRLEAGAGLGDRVEDIEQVAGGSSEPIQPCKKAPEVVAEMSQLCRLAVDGLPRSACEARG
jgi:hypothetical protein